MVIDPVTSMPAQLTAVSCGSPTLCVAITADGRVATSTDPGAASPSWTVGSIASLTWTVEPSGGVARVAAAVDCPSALVVCRGARQ